jgi:hypothetical protein
MSANGDLVRLNVNLNRETAAALRYYAEYRDISITEAVRRAISLLDFVQGEVNQGSELITRDRDGYERKLILL